MFQLTCNFIDINRYCPIIEIESLANKKFYIIDQNGDYYFTKRMQDTNYVQVHIIGDDETQGQTAYINANELAKYLLYTSHLNNKS